MHALPTAKMIKILHTLASNIYSDDEERRDFLKSNYGVESFKQLRFEDASELINKWLSLSKPRSKPTSAGNPPCASFRNVGKGRKGKTKMLTQLQADRIGILKDLLGWDLSAITNFISRQTKKRKYVVIIKTVSMLMNYEAVKVIIGMEKIVALNFEINYQVINKYSNSELKKLINPQKRITNNE